MKKLIIIGLIAVASMVFTGCGDKKNEDKNAVPDQVEDSVTDDTDTEDITDTANGSADTDTPNEDGISTLCTDDKSISVTVTRPEGFDDSEYSSEHQVAFQRLGADGTSSTQLNLRLMTEDENTVMTTAQQEVEYLLSANSDGGAAGEVQTQAAGEKQFSYFTYSLEGIEGYRIWTALDNGCILSCTAENIGSGLEPLALESLTQILSTVVQE
ncbi:hypothetical protein [Sporofaciens sp. JLR.KK001]|uniref:hypothetical protein n=1 Tax=Sporofaciens sp. JLR.KK001 TaxID=3112621 RepID=UPI002FF1FC06